MGFFSDIKSLLRDDPAGRYLAYILKSLSDLDPAFCREVFGLPGAGRLVASTEYVFSDGRRRADLAIQGQDGGEPACLVEIKVRDNGPSEHMRGQLTDYQRWAQEGSGRKVLVISPFGLPAEESAAIKRGGGEIRLLDLGSIRFERTRPETQALFLDYLRDCGYIMKKIENERASAFVHFLIGAFMPHLHGLGSGVKTSAERVAEGPLVFADLVANFQMFAQGFAGMARKPTVKYIFMQRLKANKAVSRDDECADFVVRAEREEEDSPLFTVPRERKTGGSLLLFAHCILDERYRLEFGLDVRIEKAGDDEVGPVRYYPYACAYSRGKDPSIGHVYAEDDPGAGFPALVSSRNVAAQRYRALVEELARELRKSYPEAAALLASIGQASG